MEKQRIAILDSFRAIAAIGVLWVHVWTVHRQPQLIFFGFDFMKPINIIGNGVDLFFVISGFCMYYFYNKTSASFSMADFKKFLLKRWIRLSPVFYFSTLVYILLNSESGFGINILKFLTSVFYTNSFSKYNPEGFMWSLGTEWQFYLVIPFLFILQHKLGFVKTLLQISMFFLLVCISTTLFLGEKSNILTYQIIFRFFEFLWGVVIAKLYLENFKIRYNSNVLILVFILIAYIGRMFLTEQVLSKAGEYKNLFKFIAFNIMPLGFAGLIYVCLCSQNILTKLLDNKIFHSLGRISYSFYLWHGIVHVTVGHFIFKYVPGLSDMKYALINFFVSIILLAPISYFSFKWFEIKASNYLYKHLS